MWIVDDSKELNNMVSTMNSHTVWMGEALCATEKSQLLDPPLIKKLGALKIIGRWSQLR